MGEQVIEASVRILIEKLLAIATDEIGLILGVKEDLEDLKETLGLTQGYLEHAARRQLEDPDVKLWLKKVENFTYDADNLLDEYQYETYRRTVERVEIKDQKKSKVCFSFCFSNPICFRSKMGHAIRDLNAKFNRLNAKANKLSIHSRISNSLYINPITKETTPVSGELVVGREVHTSKILDMVVNSSDKDDVSFLPIVGMGGLGKTTLARLAFNDPKAIKHFDERIWVCASTNFDTKTLFIQILGSLGKSVDRQGSLATITGNIQMLLRDKRYLLVLDDFWHEERQDWEGFKNTLLGFSSRKGNFIITTTRLQTVASMVNPQSVYQLDKLSDDDCWSLIKRKAFTTGEVPREFESIGYGIARKCRGLPLAANLIGASLQGKHVDDWTLVQQREFSNSEPGVQQILKVSYDRLPSLLLKKCFAYCALFCKDTKIEKERLIQLWMAEGFLSGNDMESLGSDVYDTLLMNSFLQEVVRDEFGNIQYSKMHDLVHDLAISVSKEDCFNDENNYRGMASHVRYLAVKSLGKESHKIMKENAIYLRTLCLGSSLADDLFRDLKRLHVLNLSGSGIQELSISVGGLIHLRLLDVSSTELSTLPDSICKLYNLQTLNIDYCFKLRRLPDNAHLLLNMRHLLFSGYPGIETPSHIGKLTCLRTLPVFSVGLEEGKRIAELGPLENLRGKFQIEKLENIKDKEESMRSDLIGKPNIHHLYLWWTFGVGTGVNNHEEVLESLQPHPNIKFLKIRGFNGDKFPAWTINMMVNDGRSLEKLIYITLMDCLRCEEIPMMGHLPFLKGLNLVGLTNVKSIGPSFYNHCYRENSDKTSTSPQTLVVPFRALEDLFMHNMHNLVEWVSPTVEISTTTSGSTASNNGTGFPLLKSLWISNVPKLKFIPSHDLGSIEELNLAGDIKQSLIVNMSCNNNLISLRKLKFSHCNITTHCLSKIIQATQHHHLEELDIFGGNLRHLEFPDEEEDDDDGHSRILPSLKYLDIRHCNSLESIGFRSGKCRPIPSLQRLFVSSCPNLASVALETPNLSRQMIKYCPKWKQDIAEFY